MNRIEKLINKLCPDGVEYKKLGFVTEMKRGTSATKKDFEKGTIPVISGGREPSFYCNKSNRDGETITVAGSGAGAGYVQYWNIPIFVNDAFSVKGNKKLMTKYIFYFLSSIQDKIYTTKKGGGVPHVNISSIESFLIPVPPIEVQREIVCILDSFTEYINLLEKELELRKKQYSYYRDYLLNFSDDVEYKTLGEIFDIRNGYTPSKKKNEYWQNGTVPWFRMDDIRENGRILSSALQKVTMKAVKNKPFPANSIIISTSATIGEHAFISVDFMSNQRFTCLSLKNEYKEKYDIMFIFYYCFKLSKYCMENLNQSSFASVDMKKFNKFQFPIISIEEQQRIVHILDRFDKLCSDISEGLPAEIEARRKQYEYYRDKILTFKEADYENRR